MTNRDNANEKELATFVKGITEGFLQEVEESNIKDKEYLEYLEKGGKPRESDFVPEK